MAPSEDGAMRKIPDDVRAEEGRALARLGDGGWDPLVQAGRRAGRFDDELVDAAAEAVRAWGAPVAWVAAVPSRRSGALVPDFAERLAAALGLPFVPALERDRRRAAAARDGQLGPAGRERPRPVRASPASCRPGRACSSTTSASAAGRWRCSPGQLRRRGAGPVYPFALATAF